jgi:DNA-binding MarR family transcriptional regulator
VIQRLVARRLVAKVRAPHDRRQLQLAVTAAGARALAQASRRGNAAQPVQEQLVRAMSRLSHPDRRVLARSLADVARAVTPKHAKAHPPMMFDEPHRPQRSSARNKSR